MTSTPRYWTLLVLMLAMGTLCGLLAGEIVEAVTEVAGWALVGGTIGFVAGLIVFLARGDT